METNEKIIQMTERILAFRKNPHLNVTLPALDKRSVDYLKSLLSTIETDDDFIAFKKATRLLRAHGDDINRIKEMVSANPDTTPFKLEDELTAKLNPLNVFGTPNEYLQDTPPESEG